MGGRPILRPVYSCPIDLSVTETKSIVLMHNAKELSVLTKGEENQAKVIVTDLADSGFRDWCDRSWI